MSEERQLRLAGLHHLTAICSDLDRTTAFYRDVLGLPLVREGASDDDPDARHFWFDAGDGTLISFLEYPSLEPGVVGVGSVQHFALAVDGPEEQDAWRERLRSKGIEATDVFERGGFRSIYLRDPDGHIVEIATRPAPVGGADGEAAGPLAEPGAPRSS
ncbi:MAG TPA: VOC family protein [Solirubrobacteraceae bacterium]|jgi:catechol 2,3-dioxygenase-like lactoylglutathione lyase family enzyme|nr:VOC family protein [Solirubrobacteraceae bacterium]